MILHVSTAGGVNGYTLQVHTASVGKEPCTIIANDGIGIFTVSQVLSLASAFRHQG
jgi:hypothetical protein